METAFASNESLLKKASFTLPELDARAHERRTFLSNQPSAGTPSMRAVSPNSLQKQVTVSMTAKDMADARQFDPRSRLPPPISTMMNDVLNDAAKEMQASREESGMGQLLLEKALSTPTSARTRGRQAPFRKNSNKSIALELMEEELAIDPPSSSSATGNKAKKPASSGSQEQMMELYHTAVISLKRKQHTESARAKLNAPEMQSVPEELRELFVEVQAFSLTQTAASKAENEQVVHERYQKVSHRVDSIPLAVARNSAGDVMILPLPGKSVEGYRVNRHGNVIPTSKLTGYMSLSANAQELKMLRDSLRTEVPAPLRTAISRKNTTTSIATQKQSRPPSAMDPMTSSNPPHNRYAAASLINKWGSARVSAAKSKSAGSNKLGLAAAIDVVQERELEGKEMEEALGPDAPYSPFCPSDGSISSDDEFAVALGYHKNKESREARKHQYAAKKHFSWLSRSEMGSHFTHFSSHVQARDEMGDESTQLLDKEDEEHHTETSEANDRRLIAEISLPALHAEHAQARETGDHVNVMVSQLQRRLELCIEMECIILDLSIVPHLKEISELDLILETILSHDAREMISGIKAIEGLISTQEALGALSLMCKQLSIGYLDLNGCKVLDKEGASLLSPLLMGGHLSHLDLSNCPVGSEGGALILAAAGSSTGLEFINLSHCGITEFKLLAAKALASSCLTHLILSGNKLQTAFAAQGLVGGLESNTTLCHLDLSHCCLHDMSAVAVSKLIRKLPNLKVLDLSHNLIGWSGAASLADEVSKSEEKVMETLILDHNPIGRESACHFINLIQMWPKDKPIYVSMTGSNLNPLPDHPIAFNPLLPSGVYHLNLASSAHFALAKRLVVEVWKPCHQSWISATLNELPLILNESMDWPASMPKQGKLTVNVLHALSMDHDALRAKGEGSKAPLMNCRLRHAAARQLSDPAADDEWRLNYIRCLTRTISCTSAQSGALLRTFEYRGRKVEAARLLLSVTVDLARFSASLMTRSESEDAPGKTVSPPLDYDDLLELLNLLGLYRKMPGRSITSALVPLTLSPGWQLSISGSYSLDLGLQAERFLAILLIEWAQKEGWAADSLAFFQSGPGLEWGKGADGSSKARIGDRRACITHASYNDQPMDVSLVLDTVNLPTAGILKFDFRNIWMSLIDKKRLLYSLHLPRQLDEALMPELPTPRKRGTMDNVLTSSMTRRNQIAHQNDRGRPRSSYGGRIQTSDFINRRIAAKAEDAKSFQSLVSDLMQLLRLPGTNPMDRNWKECCVGGPQMQVELVKEAEARHESYQSMPAPISEDEEEGGIKSKTKGKTKKGKGKGKGKEKKGKAKEDAGAASEKQLQAAASLASSALVLASDYAISHQISPPQMSLLLRLLPDLNMRLDLLTMLRSSISDPSAIIDVALTCDHPVALPIDKDEWQKMRTMQSIPVKALPAVGETTDPAEPHTEPTPPPAPIPPLHFSPGPNAASRLVSCVAARVGWSRMMMHWSRPGSLGNVQVDLSLHEPEDVQALARLCRIDELCSSAGRARGKISLEYLSGEDGPLPSILDLLEFGNQEGTQWSSPNQVDIISFDSESSLDQLLSHCKSAPHHDRLRLKIKLTRRHQEVAAAVMIQAVWRGAVARRKTMKALRSVFVRLQRENKWRVAWASFLLMRRLAHFRTSFAPDLELHRIMNSMEG